MPQGPFLRRRGRATTINFHLFEVDGIDFRVDAVHAAGDTKIMKDEGAEANTGSGFVDEGQGYSLALTDTELQAARMVVYVVDQTATKVWLDTAIMVETFEPPGLLQASDIATLASQTSFTLAEGSADNDAYNGAMAVIIDATTLAQKAVGLISDYVGATKTVTLASDPGIFTMAAGDYIDIIAVPKQLPDLEHGAAGGLPDDTDANGAVRIVDGTGARELNTNAGAVALVDVVTTLTGHTAQTGDSFARLGAPAGASVSADNAAVKAETALIVGDTGELQTDWVNGGRLDLIVDAILLDTAVIGVLGAGLTNIPWNTSWDAEVESEVTDALNAYDPPTRAEATSDKNELAAFIDTEVAAILVDTGTTIPAQIAALNDPTAAAIAVAVWDALQSAHVTGGSFGEIATEIGSILAIVNALNDISAAEVKAQIDAALTTDTIAELAQAQPAVTPTFATGLMLLYMTLRNRLRVNTVTNELEFYNDAGVIVFTKALSDAGGIYDEQKMAAGP